MTRGAGFVGVLMCVACGTTPHAIADGGDADAGADASAIDGGGGEAVHLIGRFDVRGPDALVFSYPGSAMSAHFTGTGIDVTLTEGFGTNWYDVMVDGTPSTLTTKPGLNTYPLATMLAAGEHDVTLTRRTEGFVGRSTFRGFTPTNGTLAATPFPTRKIEIIGDSVTCGYGDLGTSPCMFSAATESENAAWGAIAARQLSAVHTSIAASGRGLLRNSDGATTGVMPELWTQTLPDDPMIKWDFSRYTPDVVVVFLGGNDFATGDPGQGFVTAYTAFVKKLRSTYPNAYIVCSWFGPGPFGGGVLVDALPGYVQGVAQAAVAAGDAKVSYLAVPPYSGFDPNVCAAGGCGCDGHPSAIDQKAMGAALAAHIHGLTGW